MSNRPGVNGHKLHGDLRLVQGRPLGSRSISGGEYHAVECSGCGLEFTSYAAWTEHECSRFHAAGGVKEVAPPQSKATTANPKDLFGAVKVSTTKLPAAGIIHGAHAMMHGAVKYGAYNWRDKKVIASIYVDAAMRHLQSWFEGEEDAEDSGVHHLGHAIACCAIILDAQETGNLIDDRPQGSALASRILKRLSDKIKARKAA